MGGLQMTDAELAQIIIQLTQLRSGVEYQKAFRLLRRNRPDDMANADKKSDEYAAIRLLVGTWDRIAQIVGRLSPPEQVQIFVCHPFGLMWRSLEPAIEVLRKNIDPSFAADFEAVHRQYYDWTRTEGGHNFNTLSRQAVHACFG
jgi:hypothetical protein